MARAKQVYRDGRWADAEQIPSVEPMEGVDQRADGSIRRPGRGGRTISEMFHPDQLHREMTRFDYLNVRSVEEYQRRETKWWRKLYRALRGWPQIKNDMNRAMANSHARSLDQLREALTRKAEEVQLTESRAVAGSLLTEKSE